jgi:TonB family protein
VKKPGAALVAALLVCPAAAKSEEPSSGIVPPKLVQFVEAEYPPEEKAAGVQAQVLLSVEINAEGGVDGVEVVGSGGERFDAAAMAAVKKFRFEPARLDGEAIPVKITYRYDFVVKTEVVSLGPQVNFDGVVKERFRKRPLEGVKVRIVDLDVTAETNEDGAFAFLDVPLGKHQVELSAPSLVTIKTEEELVQGKKKTVTYLVEEREAGVDEEVVVRATRVKKESVETRIQTEEARRVPGTQGDTLKVVQNLPGVGRSSFGSGQLVVWGSAPNETRVNIDGVEIPTLYHVGGMRSVVNADIVKSIDLAPGAFSADYGRGLGGLVRVDTRELPPEGVHGYVAADLMDASALVTAVPSGGVRVALGGRISYLDKTLPAVSSADVGDFVPIPRYDDWQLMATKIFSKDERLMILVLGADDRLRRTVPANDPQEVRTEDQNTSFRRLIARYTRILDDGSSFDLIPSVGVDSSSQKLRFGSVPVSLVDDTVRYGLRASTRRRTAAGTLVVGADVQGATHDISRTGSLTLPAREGDPTVFGLPPGDEVAADQWRASVVSAAVFATLDVRFGDLSVTPGLRFEPVLIDGSRLTPKVGELPALGYTRLELAVDPRLSAAWRLGSLTLTAGAGIYHQPPDAQDLSAVFGNPTLGLSKAYHGMFGVAYKLTGTLSLETVVFAKREEDLVSRSPLATPPLARALVQEGKGRSYGGQLLLRQQLVRGFFGWLSYSLIRSERQDHPGGSWRLFDYDQTHVLSLLASYDLGAGFELGGRARYATGMPRTPVVGSWYDARTDQFQPVLGNYNSIRVPAFFALDARLEWSHLFAPVKVSLFLEVENLTNRRNPEELIYNYDYSKRSTIAGFPALAIVCARGEL